jgi:UDP-2,4-diacetamido-2,4,6-trideoxy-beta-L-altropyranose hydrolase
VVFRADAGPAIGAGHAVRCLALAAPFIEGGWAVGFAASAETFAAVAALEAAPVERMVLPAAAGEEQAIARHWPEIDLLVVDHYGRAAAFERACRGFAKRILAIDDLADREHDADVLVDAGAPANNAYRKLVPASCRVLVGPKHALVHPDFRRARGAALARRDGRAVKRVLVSFGQIDAANATVRALAALDAAGFAGAVDVVLGRAAPHLGAVRAMAAGRVRLHVDAPDMAALMSEADLAIGAGGGTAWERCCLGLPSILVTLADNQRGIIAIVAAAGAGVDAGPAGPNTERRIADALRLFLADGQRAAMAEAGAALVDGRGGERVLLAALGSQATKGGYAVALRPAELADEVWLLALRSGAETRRYFVDPTAPDAEGHKRWVEQTLADGDKILAVVEAGGAPAGTIRLDRIAAPGGAPVYQVSIAIDPAHQRRGVGLATLALARRRMPGAVLEATVLPENTASVSLFVRAGYTRVADKLYRSLPA